MRKREEGCIESDTSVTFLLSSTVTLFQSKLHFLFLFFLLHLPPRLLVNPNEFYSLESALILQVPLMANGDGYLLLIV